MHVGEMVEWSALVIGTVGTGLWALNKNQLLVSICWLLSALLWIVFAQIYGHTGLTIRDLIGVGMYLLGIHTYYRQRANSPIAIVAKPPVSVLTPDAACPICHGRGVHTLNGPGFTACTCQVEACLSSVLSAHRAGLQMEIIVVDDVSTDATCEIVTRIAARSPIPIRLIQSGTNGGPGSARSLGCAAATSEFIACIDADDLMVPSRLVSQVAALTASTDVVLCSGDVVEFYADGKRRAIQFPDSHDDLVADILFYCPTWGGAVTFRRSLLDRIDYPIERMGEDWLWGAKAANHGRIASVPEPVILYRRHHQQTTAQPGSNSDGVISVWRSIFDQFGVHPSDAELQLHVNCSPYLNSPMADRPTLKAPDIGAQWFDWSQKLMCAHGVSPEILAARCKRVTQNIAACQHLEPGSSIARMF